MSQLRASSYVIFHLLKEAGYVAVQDSEDTTDFRVSEHANIYECLRATLAHLDSMDEQPTVYATFNGCQQTFLIGRDDLDADEEVINYVETEWAIQIMADYNNETSAGCLVEFMRYMMEEADCKEDLYRTWSYGEFSSVQFEWPDCPPEAFFFSDTELFAKC